MHEIRPQFHIPNFKVVPEMLGASIEASVNKSVPGRGIIVDVEVKDVGSPFTEWRINIPFDDVELYVALGKEISKRNGIYDEHVRRGSLMPREFTIHVWSRDHKICGSLD